MVLLSDRAVSSFRDHGRCIHGELETDTAGAQPTVNSLLGLLAQIADVVSGNHGLDVSSETSAARMQIKIIMGKANCDSAVYCVPNVSPIAQVPSSPVNLVHQEANPTFVSLQFLHYPLEDRTTTLGGRAAFLMPGGDGEAVVIGLSGNGVLLLRERYAFGSLSLGRDAYVCDICLCHGMD